MAGVPAGRLSIEIVAEIARLQQDLDKAKRAVAAASGDIAKSATHANDNLARMGTTMNTVGSTSRAMRANFINLGRQVQDVGTMFALGAPPMQIFASQGAQIVDVLAMMSAEAKATNTSLGAMTAQGLARMGPYALAAAAGTLALASAMEVVTDRINENSRVTVTWQDTALGAMDAVAAFARDQVTTAFQSMGLDVGEVWQWLTNTIGGYVNTQIGHVVFAVNAIKAAWRTFPGAVAEYFVDAVNRGIVAMQELVNRGVNLLNAFGNAASAVFGQSFSQIGQISIPQIENSFRGAGAAAGAAMADASAASYRNYVGDAADYIAPFAEDRARSRMNAEAEEAGRGAGRAMGRGAGPELERALIEAMRKAAEGAEITARAVADAKDAEAEAAQNLQDKIKAEVEAQKRIQDEARRLEQDRIGDMADLYETLFTDGVDGVWSVFKKQGLAAISQIAAQWTLSLLSGQTAASRSPSGAIGALLGIGGAANDNGVAGLFGATGSIPATGPVGLAIAAASLSGTLGSGIGNLLGTGYNKTAGGALGIIPGLIGGLLGGSPKGIASLTGNSLSASGKLSGQASGAGQTVIDMLAQIASGLGGSVGSGGAVSIALRGKNWRVDPTGGGATKTGKGAIDFGQDQEAAIAYAVRNLIEDGVLGGISQAAKNLLGAGGDLEKAIEQAMMIESVPKLLKERLDPLGAALDTIDERFTKLVEALRAGGASAEQFAQAEQLYNLERAEAIAQVGSAAQTLKDFAASLAYGSNSPLSVNSQLASARSALASLDPTKDQEKYVSAAQAVLALSRQANGSSGAYFADFNAINSNLQGAISSIESRASVPGEGTVFQQQTASNTASMAAMMEEQNALLREQNALLVQANANDNGKGKIGKKRGFAA